MQTSPGPRQRSLFLTLPRETCAKPTASAKVRRLPVSIHAPAPADGLQPLRGAALFTLSKGRGRFRRPRRKSVRGLPGNQRRDTQRLPVGEVWGKGLPGTHPRATQRSPWGRATLLGLNLFKGTPVFPLSWGRGRFSRLRLKPVRGLPGNHFRVTQTSLFRPVPRCRQTPGATRTRQTSA